MTVSWPSAGAALASIATSPATRPGSTARTGTPSCLPRVMSWSIAAGRCTSAATRSGRRPCLRMRFASFAAVVVLPEPCRPASTMTVGGRSARASGVAAPPSMSTIASWTIFTTCCAPVIDSRTRSPTARSRTVAMSWRTTLRFTSASRRATRTSRSASSRSASLTRGRPRSRSNVFVRRSESCSNTTHDSRVSRAGPLVHAETDRLHRAIADVGVLDPIVRVRRAGRTGLDLPDEGLDDDRIELGARHTAKLGDGLVVTECRAVRTRRDHRLVRVGDRDDLRRKRDLVRLQSVRIAGPVVVLVMREHDRPDALEVRHLADEVCADDGMGLHLGPLVRGQCRGLPQDVFGYPDLSDVVEERAKIHGGDLIGAEAESLRDRQRVLHRGGGVALRGVILRSKRPEERRDHRDVRRLEALGGPLQALIHRDELAVALAELSRLHGVELERVPRDSEREHEDDHADEAEGLVCECERRAVHGGRQVVHRHPREVLHPDLYEARVRCERDDSRGERAVREEVHGCRDRDREHRRYEGARRHHPADELVRARREVRSQHQLPEVEEHLPSGLGFRGIRVDRDHDDRRPEGEWRAEQNVRRDLHREGDGDRARPEEDDWVSLGYADQDQDENEHDRVDGVGADVDRAGDQNGQTKRGDECDVDLRGLLLHQSSASQPLWTLRPFALSLRVTVSQVMSSQLMLSHVMSCQLTADQLKESQLMLSQVMSSHTTLGQSTADQRTLCESTPPLNAESRQTSGCP